MFNYFKNESGIGLIMVIILLVLVGGLTAALLTAGIFNIGFGADEVDRARAFYTADAGVEYTKAYIAENGLNENDFPINKDLDYNNENFSTNFEIELISSDDVLATFRSTGKINNDSKNRQEQEIEFSLLMTPYGDVAVILNLLDGVDEDFEYFDLKGAEKALSEENIKIVELLEWWDFLEKEYGTFDMENDIYGEDPEFEPKNLSKINNEEVNEDLFLTPDLVEISGQVHEWIEDEEFNNNTTVFHNNRYFNSKSKHDAKGSNEPGKGDDWKDYWEYEFEDWGEGKEYSANQDDTVYHNGSYYTTLEDHTSSGENEPGTGGGLEYWTSTDQMAIRSTTIEDSIIIVNGELQMLGNVNLKSSLILVRDKVEFGGNTNMDDSLILSFNENSNEHSLTTRGNPSIDLDFLTQKTVEKWDRHGNLKEILDKASDNGGTIGSIFTWRQVR